MKKFNQFETKHKQPEKSGVYNTDKGELYWSPLEFSWSCREDKISEEYPKYWYEVISEEEGIKALRFAEWISNNQFTCYNAEWTSTKIHYSRCMYKTIELYALFLEHTGALAGN